MKTDVTVTAFRPAHVEDTDMGVVPFGESANVRKPRHQRAETDYVCNLCGHAGTCNVEDNWRP